ncbi:MAG: DUF362 domain-containing protein [Gemmatimonadetes bacterium]|nr:DUF362 domain-containing protein [Gemmatimonadota bacterium]
MASATTVGIGTGSNRRENVRVAVERSAPQLASLMGEEVMLKPNFLSGTNPVVCTHPDAVRGVLDVIMTLPEKPRRVLIAEGGNESEPGECFRHMGYTDIPDEYDIPIELVDLNRETRWRNTRVYMVDGTWTTVRMPRTVLECPCVISVALAKTHDGAMVTLALKNLIMGTILKKDRIKVHGYTTHHDRRHPQEARALSRNLIRLARHLYPHYSVVDGTIGIQGNGPGGTDTVPLGLAAAGEDTIAVDAVISKAMGFEPLEVGTVFYGDAIGLGVGDLERIRVNGGRLDELALSFKGHESIDLQRQWAIEGAWESAAVGG